MSIALPGSARRSLSGLLGLKSRDKPAAARPVETRKQLKANDVAKLFSGEPKKPIKPAKLNDNEKQERAEMSNLRGALYSKD